ncbi:MAG: hypothetical protein ABFE02_08700 [Sulfuricella sp.]
MNRILTMVWLACGLAVMPVAYAADVAPADQKKDQKAAGEDKDKDKKAGEEGKGKGEKKGDGGAEPECN